MSDCINREDHSWDTSDPKEKRQFCAICKIDWRHACRIKDLEAEKERYRQIAEHMFSPSTTDRDTCNRCSLNFRDEVHSRDWRVSE